MSVAHRLNKTEDEIAHWPLRRLARWMAYFKIVKEEEVKAHKEAQAKARQAPKSGKGW